MSRLKAGAAYAHLLTHASLVAWALFWSRHHVFSWVAGALELPADWVATVSYLATVAAAAWAYPLGLILAGWEILAPIIVSGRPSAGQTIVIAGVVYWLLLSLRKQWRSQKALIEHHWRTQFGLPSNLRHYRPIFKNTTEPEPEQQMVEVHYSGDDENTEDGTPPALDNYSEPLLKRDPDYDPFDALIGVDEAVSEIKDVMELPLNYPEKLQEYRLELPKAIMLYGPPGTGKTSIARATAAHYNCGFTVVNASSMADRYVGGSEANIRRIFEYARAHKPHIIFFDEIDAIAQKRDGQHMNRPSDILINVLLTELDGFDPTANRGVFIIAATNRLDIIDPAILRPGRFDRCILVGLPDTQARAELWELYLRGRPLAEDIDFQQLAEMSQDMSPADILGRCNTAAKIALKRDLAGGDPLICFRDLVFNISE